MKLWYDRKSKNPTYFVQLGIRNGKKTTTKNIDRIGRQSDLLKITFDPNLVNRFLTCDRILAPDSKHGSLHHMANYYEQPAFDYMHIMRTMDLMADHYDEYIFHLFEKKQ